MAKVSFEDKLNLIPEEYATARQIGLAPATLGAMARRGLIEVKDTTPKQYRKNNSPAAKIYRLLEQNKEDYDNYFTLRKSNEKLGMLCSILNNTVVDCWGSPYDLSSVTKLELRTKTFEI